MCDLIDLRFVLERATKFPLIMRFNIWLIDLHLLVEELKIRMHDLN